MNVCHFQSGVAFFFSFFFFSFYLPANCTPKITNDYELKIDWGKTSRGLTLLLFSRTLQHAVKSHFTEITTMGDQNCCNPRVFLP